MLRFPNSACTATVTPTVLAFHMKTDAFNYFCYKILATRSLLPDPGYKILASRSWLPDLGYEILATRSWLPDGYSYRCGYNCIRLAKSGLCVVGNKSLVRHTWIQQLAYMDIYIYIYIYIKIYIHLFSTKASSTTLESANDVKVYRPSNHHGRGPSSAVF